MCIVLLYSGYNDGKYVVFVTVMNRHIPTEATNTTPYTLPCMYTHTLYTPDGACGVLKNPYTDSFLSSVHTSTPLIVTSSNILN